LIFCYFFIKKKVKRIRVICSEAEDYDKKEIIFELRRGGSKKVSLRRHGFGG
jgi:hypothetical protein